MKKGKNMKEGLFLLPAVVIAAGAMIGFQRNIPSFPELPTIQTAEGKGTERVDDAAENTEIKEIADKKKKKASAKKEKGTAVKKTTKKLVQGQPADG